MARAQRRETISPTQFRRRMRDLGATEQGRYRRADRQIWYSGPHKVWIEVKAGSGGNLNLAFYATCPCGG